jgi:lipoprotein signal peptidase
MKKKLLSFAILLFTACLFSTNSFSQPAPGDDGTGDGETLPVEGGGTLPSTYTFKSFTYKRNNGNGWGVCGTNAQIRVVFDPMPTCNADIPKLTTIEYKGTNLLANGYAMIIASSIVTLTQPYVSYCIQGIQNLPGASDGNIPPADKVLLKFNNQ